MTEEIKIKIKQKKYFRSELLPRYTKGVSQGYILSPYLFNVYAEYIMRNAELDDIQAGIKTAERNINNLRYADDIPP